MNRQLNILVTNDDGIDAKGLKALVELLQPYGRLTIVAPKYHQSGMSMAVSMGYRQIAIKKVSESDNQRWYYLDGTPASCVKYGIDNVFIPEGIKPDVVVSGINHGNNAATATIYSATIGAAMEGAVNRVLSIGVSLDNFSFDADFSVVKRLFPAIFEQLIDNQQNKYGTYYNVNFPDLPAEQIKGVRMTHQGRVHWEREYRPFDAGIYDRLGITKKQFGILYTPEVEEGEELFMMAGDYTVDSDNVPGSDYLTMREGYITITPQSIEVTDTAELDRLRAAGFDKDF